MNKYMVVVKPGILLSNLLTVVVGYFLASQGGFDWSCFLSVSLGITLLMASSTSMNNYIDRDIDQLMIRTSNRPSVKGVISGTETLVLSFILLLLGLIVLYFGTNVKAFFVSVIGYIVYVVLYSLYLKRNSIHSTLVGSISGGVPPVVGYLAWQNDFDIGCLIIFAILVVWQMVHFYAIGIYRLKDYQDANIKILPVVIGVHNTKIHIAIWSVFFIPVSLSLFFYGYTGLTYLFLALIGCVWWCKIVFSGFKKGNDDQKWARKVFIFSVMFLTVLCFEIIADVIIFNRG